MSQKRNASRGLVTDPERKRKFEEKNLCVDAKIILK
jgi:hypothetical protein